MWWVSNLGNAIARNMKLWPGRNPYELVLVQSAQHLQKSDSYSLNSERKKILTSSQPPLACFLLLLAIFWCHLVNFPSENSILPYFSSPRGVAILDCESHSQAGKWELDCEIHFSWGTKLKRDRERSSLTSEFIYLASTFGSADELMLM